SPFVSEVLPESGLGAALNITPSIQSIALTIRPVRRKPNRLDPPRERPNVVPCAKNRETLAVLADESECAHGIQPRPHTARIKRLHLRPLDCLTPSVSSHSGHVETD